VTADHARAFLHAGDAILSVLLNALEGKEPDLTVTREPYERFQHLNERIDRAVSIGVRVDEDADRPVVVFAVATGPRDEAIEIRIEPSRLLYGIDRSAYVEVLRMAAAVVEEAEVDEEPTSPEEAELPVLAPALASPLLAEVVPSYSGRLIALRPALQDFLMAEVSKPVKAPAGDAGLTDSLLATADKNMGLDWKQREPIQARLKVAFKRVLVQCGIDSKKAEEVAERLVTWMRIQVPDDLAEVTP